MVLKQLNTFLQGQAALVSTPLFIFITGASGAGKTHLAQTLEQELDPQFVAVKFFDRIGVPPLEEMIKEHGSGEKWQEAMTHQWIQNLTTILDKQVIIFEGQFNPQFAIDACKIFGVHLYAIVLLHADKKTRGHRLIEYRRQPELVNETMDNWAEFLKAKTEEVGGTIINTSDSDTRATLLKIAELVQHALTGRKR
ncbi:MAG: zeta toxin family protein [Alphaproteobacteria bacterium]|nr:zeta toxin family protein [Alphaproteobacteria bacterium]